MRVCRVWLELVVMVGVGVLVTACALTPSSPTPFQSPTATGGAVSVTPGVTPVPSPSVRGITLTLWVTPLLAPLEEDEGSRVLREQLDAFAASHPGVTVDLQRRAETGPASLAAFLEAAAPVAPALLPDLIAVPYTQLPDLAHEGLIRPLDELISSTLQADLFPFALESGRVDGRLVGVAFGADVGHMVYNTAKLDTAPITWTDVLSSEEQFLFPSKGEDGLVHGATLAQYMAAGGTLVDAEGHAVLDENVLTAVLEFYRDGLDLGVIPSDILAYTDEEMCWRAYLQASVAMVYVRSDRYLADRPILLSSQPASIPTRNGVPFALGESYAWAVVATEPERQDLAVELLNWLMEPERQAEWAQAAHHLPTRRSTFAFLGEDEPWPTMKRLLDAARIYPYGKGDEQSMEAIQVALEAVLHGEAAPEEAAAMAVEMLQENGGK